MFLTVHSSIGAVIGSNTANPALSFVLGFFSHFLLDKIPHAEPGALFTKAFRGEKRPKKEVIQYLVIVFFDTLTVLALAWFLMTKDFITPLPTLAGILGSIAPDYMFGLGVITKSKVLKKFDALHLKSHYDPKKTPVGLVAGSLSQLIVMAAALKILFA